MNGIKSFTWKRDDLVGVVGQLEQAAVENSGAASNFLTYYDPSSCEGGTEYCSFSSILFADFYIQEGEVVGDGAATMMFEGSRRLAASSEDSRKLQAPGTETSSSFGLNVGLNAEDDGGYRLKTAGGSSYGGFAVLVVSTMAIIGSAILLA